jgi:hypothetical protein
MKEHYQGKNLAYLLLALCLPAGLLYLRLVFGLAASDSRLSRTQNSLFENLALAALVAFFVAQILSAFHIQRLVPHPRTAIGKAAGFVAALLVGILFSLTGAITLEAFGFASFLRFAGAR